MVEVDVIISSSITMDIDMEELYDSDKTLHDFIMTEQVKHWASPELIECLEITGVEEP